MPTFVLFHEFAENISGGIDLNSDVFKLALTNILPDQANDMLLADITEIAPSDGYVAGGAVLTGTSWAETGAGTGIWRFDSDDVVFTASGGDIAAHQYGVLYSDTSTGDLLIGYIDRGSSSIVANGNSRTWTLGADGWFIMAISDAGASGDVLQLGGEDLQLGGENLTLAA